MQVIGEKGVWKRAHNLFFIDDLSSDKAILDPVETRHAVTVLRSQPGDILQLTDGRGCIAFGRYDSIEKGRMHLSIVERTVKCRMGPEIYLFAGLPDRDAFERLLLDAAALGVCRIVPVAADHCRKIWWSEWGKHLPRFQRKMTAALKQSISCFMPEIFPPCATSEAISAAEGFNIVADVDGQPLHALTRPSGQTPVSCFIGPPGGFSAKEMLLFEKESFHRVRIAHTRLRTELAATALCAQVTGMCL